MSKKLEGQVAVVTGPRKESVRQTTAVEVLPVNAESVRGFNYGGLPCVCTLPGLRCLRLSASTAERRPGRSFGRAIRPGDRYPKEVSHVCRQH
jgi:hypothetical protein